MIKASFPGQVLRHRREELGLSLGQVHEHIRVPVEYIRALEEGALEKLPSYTYSAGFLQSYCQLLNLSPEPFQVEFRSATHRRQHQPVQRDRGHHPSPSIMDRIPQPAWLTEVLAWGTICAFIIIGWVAYSVIVKPFAENAESRVEAGQTSIDVPLIDFEADHGYTQP
jgi:cytoskeleton protein RodZ